jgi:peptidoglycan/xylan/chitin deacetylase (PgdA/CDA1 family)
MTKIESLDPFTNLYAIMFHHFHGGEHPESQGSINDFDFRRILDHLNQNYTLLAAPEWLKKWTDGTLIPGEVCLTFDDGLKCQKDIAIPVLNEYELTAFWFIYSSPLLQIPSDLEVYRYFRTSYFPSIDTFYIVFFEHLKKYDIGVKALNSLSHFDPSTYLTKSSFYSKNDKIFRYLRDVKLGAENYQRIMDDLIDNYGLSTQEIVKILWMNRDDIKNLADKGHVIGLHSHTHPTELPKLSYKDQLREFQTNQKILESIVGYDIMSASYPCGKFNEHTLNVLEKLNIRLGFEAFQSDENFESMRVPRLDHSLLLSRI